MLIFKRALRILSVRWAGREPRHLFHTLKDSWDIRNPTDQNCSISSCLGEHLLCAQCLVCIISPSSQQKLGKISDISILTKGKGCFLKVTQSIGDEVQIQTQVKLSPRRLSGYPLSPHWQFEGGVNKFAGHPSQLQEMCPSLHAIFWINCSFSVLALTPQQLSRVHWAPLARLLFVTPAHMHRARWSASLAGVTWFIPSPPCFWCSRCYNELIY